VYACGAAAYQDFAEVKTRIAGKVKKRHVLLLAERLYLRRQAGRNKHLHGVVFSAGGAAVKTRKLLAHVFGLAVGYAANKAMVAAENIDVGRKIAPAALGLETDLPRVDGRDLMQQRVESLGGSGLDFVGNACGFHCTSPPFRFAGVGLRTPRNKSRNSRVDRSCDGDGSFLRMVVLVLAVLRL